MKIKAEEVMGGVGALFFKADLKSIFTLHDTIDI